MRGDARPALTATQLLIYIYIYRQCWSEFVLGVGWRSDGCSSGGKMKPDSRRAPPL